MTLFSALAFVGCKDDTENNAPNNGNTTEMEQMLIGCWQAMTDEGYEVYNGMRDEWNDDLSAEMEFMEFRADHTLAAYIGVETGYEMSVIWLLQDSKIYLQYAADEIPEYIGTIIGLDQTTLTLEAHEKEEGYEYYGKTTYRRVE